MAQTALNYAAKLRRDREFEASPGEYRLLFSSSVVRVLREWHNVENCGELMSTCSTRDGYEFDIDTDSIEVVGTYA